MSDIAIFRQSRARKVVYWVVARVVPFYPVADEFLTAKDSFGCGQKFTSGLRFQEVALRSVAQSCSFDIGVRVLIQEEHFRAGIHLPQPLPSLNSVQLRRPISSTIKSGFSSSPVCTASIPSDAAPITRNSD